MNIIDGSKIALDIKNELREKAKNYKHVCLSVVMVGDDEASKIYIKHKKQACEYIGIKIVVHKLGQETTEHELLNFIDNLNRDSQVHGILLQLPLPAHIDKFKMLSQIDPNKDVDGFHPYNAGLLNVGTPTFVPCTAIGIMELIKRSDIAIEGKHCVVLGRSNIVGKPVADLLLKENGTVTICHSKTSNLKEICKQADILVVAIGQPRFITSEYIKQGAVVIDVGIHREESSKKLCGDVDFEACKEVASYITPVPGGVGPMTIAMLMQNCIRAARINEKR